METKKCRECGKEINKKAVICPSCGCVAKRISLKLILIILSLIIIAFLITLIVPKSIKNITKDIGNKEQTKVYGYLEKNDTFNEVTVNKSEKISNNEVKLIDDYLKVESDSFIKFYLNKDDTIEKYELCFKYGDIVCIKLDDYDKSLKTIINSNSNFHCREPFIGRFVCNGDNSTLVYENKNIIFTKDINNNGTYEYSIVYEINNDSITMSRKLTG